MSNYINYATDVRGMNFGENETTVATEHGIFELPSISEEIDGFVAFYIDENGLWVQPVVAIKLLEEQWEMAVHNKIYHQYMMGVYYKQLGEYRSRIMQLAADYGIEHANPKREDYE